MNDTFNKLLWDLGRDTPEVQEAIAHSMSTASKGYSIPTRQYCKATGEVEDIHTALIDIEEEETREKLTQAIKKIDSMTVGELAKMLNFSRVALLLKEAEGHELTEPEKTIRDIDISLFALVSITGTKKVIGRKKPIEDK